MESLAAAGIPLYGEAGHAGGYRLVDGYRTRLTGLDAGEAESLMLVGLPAAAADLGLGPAAAGARRKLLAALPADHRDRAGRLQDRVHVDTPGWYDDGAADVHQPLIAGAVWERRRVAVRYRRWQTPREVNRTLDPHGLVLKAGNWYVVARSGGQLRTFRVSNIIEARLLDESFERAAGFDLAAHWREYLEDYHARRLRGEAVLRLSARGLERLPDLFGPALVRAARRSASGPDGDGWVRLAVPTEATELAIPELLKVGADVEVLAPPALRDRIEDVVRRMSALYARR